MSFEDFRRSQGEYAPEYKSWKDLRLAPKNVEPLTDKKEIGKRKDELVKIIVRLTKPGLSPAEEAELLKRKAELKEVLKASGVDMQ